jgi:hypothetical protein
MADTIKVKFRLEGASYETASWAELRNFVDKLVEALAAMDGGPSPTDILPIAVKEGSLIPVMRLPRQEGLRATKQLCRGPTRRWSLEQRRRADPLYRFLEQHGYGLTCGVRTMRPVQVPRDRPDWRIRQAMSLEGEVRRAGGARGGVDMVFNQHGHLHCKAGREISKALAARLYDRVSVSGVAETDPATGALLSFRIENFRPIEQPDFLAGLRAMHQLLADDVDDIDPAAILAEM